MKQVDNNVAVKLLAQAYYNYDRCNPDIGMGPSWNHFINQAVSDLEIGLTDIDYNSIVDELAKENNW